MKIRQRIEKLEQATPGDGAHYVICDDAICIVVGVGVMTREEYEAMKTENDGGFMLSGVDLGSI